jgi:sortase B
LEEKIMSLKGNMKKAKMQKIIAIVCILLIVIVLVVVILATRDKKEEITVETTETITTTAPETTEETTTSITYDYEMKIDLEKVNEYHEQNEDVVGWIYIDDTPIDYPIVKGEDNDEYIYSDWMGDYSYSGSIFEDYRCDINKDENTLIYGHNMAAGTMFHSLKSYKDEDWGMDHLFVEVATLDTRYLYEVFSVNVLDGLAGADFEYWNFIGMDEDDYTHFYNAIKKSATVWYAGKGANNDPVFDDRLLTLQTCDTGDDDGIRCVAFAKCLGDF